jgi:hypothetical protein
MRPCPATRRRPGPAAAPSTSPGPAIPRSRPARKTRNAGRRGHGRLPGAARSARPMPQAFPRPCSWAFPTPDDREPSIQHPPLQAATVGPGRTEPNVNSGPAKDPSRQPRSPGRALRTGRRQRPVKALLRLSPILICLTQTEDMSSHPAVKNALPGQHGPCHDQSAHCSVALDSVLGQSGRSGIFLNPTYRGFNMTWATDPSTGTVARSRAAW